MFGVASVKLSSPVLHLHRGSLLYACCNASVCSFLLLGCSVLMYLTCINSLALCICKDFSCHMLSYYVLHLMHALIQHYLPCPRPFWYMVLDLPLKILGSLGATSDQHLPV
ncbi:hypothetical protein Droror1_Dr00000077 [Drosera rotundifolia]